VEVKYLMAPGSTVTSATEIDCEIGKVVLSAILTEPKTLILEIARGLFYEISCLQLTV
jgi:hypothetical protein